MTESLSYTHRRHAFEAEKTIAIEGDDLVLREGAGERRLALKDVAKIRLAFEPSRVQDDLYTCRIWAKGQVKPWTVLHSNSYRGIMDFDGRGLAYRTFVSALNDAVIARNPSAAFRVGTSVLMYVLNIGIVVVAFAALAWVLVLTDGEGWPESAWVKIALALVLVPVLVFWARRNWPRSYDPRAIGDQLLP